MKKELREYMKKIGSNGGSAGTGLSKVRGTQEYYRKLGAKSALARKKKKAIDTASRLP